MSVLILRHAGLGQVMEPTRIPDFLASCVLELRAVHAMGKADEQEAQLGDAAAAEAHAALTGGGVGGEAAAPGSPAALLDERRVVEHRKLVQSLSQQLLWRCAELKSLRAKVAEAEMLAAERVVAVEQAAAAAKLNSSSTVSFAAGSFSAAASKDMIDVSAGGSATPRPPLTPRGPLAPVRGTAATRLP